MKSDNFFGFSSMIVFDISVIYPEKNSTDDQTQRYKLLFGYPKDSTKLHLLSGLIEGLIHIGRSFGSTKSIELIKTKLFTLTLHEWEKDLFIAMTFKNDAKNIDPSDQLRNADQNDFRLKKISRAFGMTFTLIHGSPRAFTRDELGTLLNTFLLFFIKTDHSKEDLVNDLNFVRTAALTPKNCLVVELFAAHLLDKFKEIRYLSLVHSGCLIHQGISLDDFRLLFNWLTLAQSAPANDLTFTLFEVKEYGYLIGLSGKKLYLPVVTLSEGKRHALSVLQHHSLLLIMLLDDSLKDDIQTKTLLNSIRETAKTDLGGMKQLYESITPGLSNSSELILNYVTGESQGALDPKCDILLAMSFYNLVCSSHITGSTNEIPPYHKASLVSGGTTITSSMDLSNHYHISSSQRRINS